MFRHVTSGLYLTHYRAYDPKTARWLSRDPIEEAGGVNLYADVSGNPITRTDPSGLQAIPRPRPLLPLPPVFIPGTPENQSFTESTLRALQELGKLLTPKSPAERCEAQCDANYDHDAAQCEAWWKTTGRNGGSLRICMERVRKTHIQCLQDCKKECP